MNTPTVSQMNGLVDQTGPASQIFFSQEIYQQELERISARCWLYLGHESQPNDFIATYMGGRSDIAVPGSGRQDTGFLEHAGTEATGCVGLTG
jgi:ethylbenzene dioxygenase alpha subunit